MRRKTRSGWGRLAFALGTLVIVLLVGWNVASMAVSGIGHAFGLASTVAKPAVQIHRTYTVQPGDTLSGIAARFGISTDLLVRANHLHDPNSIQAGRTLVVPSPYHPALTRRLVEQTASRYQIEPAFADAVAYQESGFNENAVSPTGAVGVMQVEPDTANFVANLLGRSFDLGVESDNITVGVYWLSQLVAHYHGDERSAAAAYFEGEGNLARHGYLNGTGQYVANVMALRQRFLGHQ